MKCSIEDEIYFKKTIKVPLNDDELEKISSVDLQVCTVLEDDLLGKKNLEVDILGDEESIELVKNLFASIINEAKREVLDVEG